MPTEGGPGTATTPEAVEARPSMRRYMANFFIGPEGGLTYQTEQARNVQRASEESLKKKTGKAFAYPFKVGGMTMLAGGIGTGGALWLLGKGAQLALEHPTHWAIHYDQAFGKGFDSAWKMTRQHMGVKSRDKK